MVSVGLLVRLEAKIDKIAEVEAFLKNALPLVEAEPNTVAWFAIRLSPTTFGIFDVFPNEAGRQQHLAGDVAAALRLKGEELFTVMPDIETLDVLAAKLPASGPQE